MNEIQKIKPSGIFTNYIYKAIPLAFDESMSYYETLCALLDYLKTTTDVVNNNAELLAELETYVKTYFDNLDVQDEINNKLDQMVTDGTMDEIINQEIFGEITSNLTSLNNDVNDIKQDLKTKTNDNLEYMWTHHTTLSGFQALCVDDTSYYYYEGNTYNLYKRNLSDNELSNTYNIPSFGHGNDMTIINGVIYNANFNDKYINTYKLSDGTIGIINCLNDVTSYGIISGITKYDNTHLLVMMAPSGANSSTKLSDCGLYKVDIVNNIYNPLNLNSNNIDLTSTSVIQSCEYVNGNLYCLTSQPSMITQFIENDQDFDCVNIYDFHDFDVNGLPYGEMEGIALLPNTFNGDGTMLVYSQMKDYSTNKSLKFYCFNPMIKLPLVRIPIHQDSSGNSTELTNLYLNANDTNYYEIGTANYPFHHLIDAINAYNFSNLLHFKDIQINGAGTYTINNCRNLKINIYSTIAGVIISGAFSFANCKVHIEGNDTNQITLNMSSGYINNSDIDFINCSINYTPTGALNFLNTKLLIWKTHVTTNGLFAFESSIANLLFRSFTTTREDGKFFNIDNNNLVTINNPTGIIPTSAINKGYSVVLRYNSVSLT